MATRYFSDLGRDTNDNVHAWRTHFYIADSGIYYDIATG